MPNQIVICRVQNLTSAKGQKLNGLSCSFDLNVPPSGSDGRVAVTIDGVKGPQLSLKLDNLYISESYEDLAVAVGRQDLRSKECMATVVDQKKGIKVTGQMLPTFDENITALRSRGTLMALLQYFETQQLPKVGDIMIHVTDLNIALLLNSYAVKKVITKTKTLGSDEQRALAEKVGKHIIRECRKRVIIFKYTPFRINRNGNRLVKELMACVLAAKFHIYPCPCETFLDALEVRFLLPGRTTHDFFLDYGQDETIQYVNNIFNMEEDMERLKPDVLADVDPQMFWSSVLHSKALIKALKGLPECPDDLIKDWSNIYGSYLKSIATFKEACFSASESVRMLPDSKGKWNLINNEIHYNVAFHNAKLAVMISLSSWPVKDKLPRIEIMDNYIGSEIDRKVGAFTKALSSKDPMDIEIALQDITSWNETKTCDYCGKHKKHIFDCTRCKGAGYCDSACQKKAWPTHRRVCKDLEKAKKDEPKNTMSKAKMYNPKKIAKNQSGINVLGETSAFGFIRIIYAPLMGINAIAFTALRKDTIFKSELGAIKPFGVSDLPRIVLEADESKAFNSDMSNLDPIMRLCVSCGPIPNLELAQHTLDDALIHANGSVPNLKMKWVGFTALEWAAKKGNMEIVQWLISDPRTTSLVDVGTPVGWACYTGRIEIARLLVNKGVSPNATHEGFWDSRPPLLAAAENGKLDAVKFLVEECGIDISSAKWKGNGIKEHVQMSPNWNETPDLQAVLKYAKLKLKKGKRK
jgi:hypothetical protein